jgi:carbamate kinase
MSRKYREDPPIAIVAMGGHAFIQKGESGTIEDHERNAATITEKLMCLIERNHALVVTHGNGPQVGSLLLQQEATKSHEPVLPLDVLVAMTQGSLGYILQQALLNQMNRQDIRRYVVTIVTQVFVDENDPAFDKPTKPIGPFLEREEAERRRDTLGWEITEDPQGRGWRRLVASPKPQKVLQRDMIRDEACAGHIVVACGGGGIPIKRTEKEGYVGVEAVVDKDLTSSVLATNIGAELLIILTAVPNVFVNFGKPDQKALTAVTLEEVEKFHEDGQFPPGSMGPKIEAVIRFLRQGGRRALITDPASLPDAIEGRAGTHVIGKL